MNIILKRLSRLKTEEITFVFAMMSTYGDLKIEESPSQNTKNKNKNRNKGKTKKPPKVIKNHDDCKPEEPCYMILIALRGNNVMMISFFSIG